MKLVIDISEYNREWINNGYRIPEEINQDITRAIVDGEPLEPERKVGKWKIEYKSEQEIGALNLRYRVYECPFCGWDNSLIIPRNFCPKCGADMRGKDDGYNLQTGGD